MRGKDFFKLSIFNLIYLSLFFSLLFHSCSQKNLRGSAGGPDWVNGESKKYKKEVFLTAVGTGINRKETENQARLGIAQIFQVQIDSEIKQSHVYKGKESQQSSSYSLDHKLSNEMRLVTDQMLEGVEIAEVWEDTTGRYFALAVLHRMNATARLRQQINQLDQKLDHLLQLASQKPKGRRSSRASLELLRLYMQMEPLVQKRKLYQNQLLILSSDFFDSPKKNYDQIETTLKKLLSQFSIGIKISGEGSKKIKGALIEGLTKAHFQVADTPSSSTIVLRGTVESEYLSYEDAIWKWAKIELNVDLVDNHTKKIFGRVNKTRKEGSKDINRAHDIALQKISEELVMEINDRLWNYLKEG